jgi:hypothetical protein
MARLAGLRGRRPRWRLGWLVRQWRLLLHRFSPLR